VVGKNYASVLPYEEGGEGYFKKETPVRIIKNLRGKKEGGPDRVAFKKDERKAVGGGEATR